MFIHFAQTVVFNAIQQTCIFFNDISIYVCIFLKLFVWWRFLYSVLWIHCQCGWAHAASPQSNTGTPNRCFSLVSVLFSCCLQSCHLICLASDCLRRHMHGNVTLCIHRVSVSCRHNNRLMPEREKKHWIKDADVGKRIASLFTLNTGAFLSLRLVVWSSSLHPSDRFCGWKKVQKKYPKYFPGHECFIFSPVYRRQFCKRATVDLSDEDHVLYRITSPSRRVKSPTTTTAQHNTTLGLAREIVSQNQTAHRLCNTCGI